MEKFMDLLKHTQIAEFYSRNNNTKKEYCMALAENIQPLGAMDNTSIILRVATMKVIS